jgi:nickel-dependent lactate racemase
MTIEAKTKLYGRGGPNLDLLPEELRSIVEQSLSHIVAKRRVLAVIPDSTRDDNTDLLLPLVAQTLSNKGVSSLDALVAQGTHPPMTEAEKRKKIGLTNNSTLPLKLVRIFDHQWDKPEELVSLGELSSTQVQRLTDGLFQQAIPVRLNRLLQHSGYDLALVFGATVPHEVAGFSGGAKYFFPGIAGPELTHLTHWLGALTTIEQVIGKVETPIRHLIEAAAEFISAEVISFNSVVTRDAHNRLHTRALFAGDIKAAFRRAAEVSRSVHIKYTGRKYKRVVALLDEHYEEMWVGGKASYKLGGIIEPGGELIIYAPHLHGISKVHGQLIERYGYAPLEAVREMVSSSSELQANLCVAAHLAHVSYAGRSNENGRIVPRYRITLASSINEETCRRVKMGFMPLDQFRISDYGTDENTLIVENAGRDLYLAHK